MTSERSADLSAVNEYLHAHIPVTAHMQVEVVAREAHSIRLAAPLEPNLNHRETAFGGSIASLAIVSGWTLLHLLLRESGRRCRLVVFRSQTDFTAPIDDRFEAESRLREPDGWPRLLRALDRKGKGRARVTTTVSCGATVAATQEATYVAVLLDPSDSSPRNPDSSSR